MNWILGAVHDKLNTLLNRTFLILQKVSQPHPVPPPPDLTPILEAMGQMEARLNERLDSIDQRLSAIEVLLSEPPRPPMPGLMELIVTEQTYSGDTKMLNFKLVLPPPGAPDVVSRELSVLVASTGTGAVISTHDASTTEVGGFSGIDNDQVEVTLTDTDDAGNKSEVRNQTFALTDTIAPPQPGQIGLVVESET